MNRNLSQKIILKKVVHRIQRYWGILILSLFLALIYVALSLYIPVLIGYGIDAMTGAGEVDFSLILHYLLQILTFALTAALSQWIMSSLNNRVVFQVTRDVRNEIFGHIQKLPLSYLDRHPNGNTVSCVIADVDGFADGLLMGFSHLFTGVMTIAGTLAFMIHIHWIVALVVFLITPVSLLAANFIARRTFVMFQQQAAARGELTEIIDETIGSLKTVKAFSHENTSLEQFSSVNERLKKCSLKATFFSSITNPCTRFVNSIVYSGVGLSGAVIAINGGISVGALTAFLNYANQYTKPFNEISGVVTELQNSLACAGRIFAFLEEPAENAGLQNSRFSEKIKGQVDIQNLYFSYTPDKPLIENLNLSVKPGMRVAIVGPTGCGKTTFINLLMRFYDPADGRILLDGIDTRQTNREALRRCVGMVLQDTWLKAGTIRDNIALGLADASDSLVLAAARQAHAHDFIKRLPNGYDTVIGEGGEGLSQGQKQLLCIARVMLSLPPMLFLDEATSSIDTRTEQKIQKAFDTMMQGRTSFIVAHRLTTIQGADLILVMRDGQVIERGTHEQLLQKRGFYFELYHSQFAH